MKKRKLQKFIFLSSLAAATSFTVMACKPAEVVVHIDFSFNPTTKVKNRVYMGVDETIGIIESKDKGDKTQRTYRFSLLKASDSQYLTVNANTGDIHPVAPTPKKGQEGALKDYEVDIRVFEIESELQRLLHLKVVEKFPEATGGFNYAGNAVEKVKILGKLEEFAVSNFLTGISLFENGGYVAYSRRVDLPVSEYISGYGFGLLREGNLKKDGTSWKPGVPAGYKDYLCSGTSSDPLDINAWMATGSQISDLNSYISSSYYGTRINQSKTTEYEWYPVLADDDYADPVAIDSDGNPVSEPGKASYKTWRVYLKTDRDDVKFHLPDDSTLSKSKYERPVTIDDYEFVFKMLLTGGTKLKRGTELASDTSYGFKGAYAYNLQTSSYKGESMADYIAVESAWQNFKKEGGLRTSKDIEGEHYSTYRSGGGKDYIQFELVNPVDQFTAKYTLSSNLYTPMSQEFIEHIGGDFTSATSEDPAQGKWIPGASLFGRFAGTSISNRVLCVGPYHLHDWNKGLSTSFARSDEWFEHAENPDEIYQIPGVYIRVITGATQKPDAIYEEWVNGNLDSAGVPSNRLKEKPADAKKVKGDSTFKLNVNSCSQERWKELNEEVFHQTKEYKVKPFMSNTNFLNGLFWSIDRATFAANRGTDPSFNYFSSAYLSNPNNDIDPEDPDTRDYAAAVYNDTKAHKDAMEAFGIDMDKEADPTTAKYGYDKAKAINYFRMAVNQLVAEGKLKYGSSKTNHKTIYLDIQWMYPSDEKEYGQAIAKDFEAAFNDDQVCGGRIQLKVRHAADPDWQQVYNDHLMVGKFDLGFGAISGNTLSPLNFMEVLRSDNSSGFTLNWGADTGKVDPVNPISYDNKEWTFDSLWASADHGCVVKNAIETKSVTDGYVMDGGVSGTGDFEKDGGGYVDSTFKFAEVTKEQGVTFSVDRIQLYLVGAGTFAIDPDQITYFNAANQEITETTEDKVIAKIRVSFTEEDAHEINNLIYLGNKYDKEVAKLDPDDPEDAKKIYEYQHMFQFKNYYSTTNGQGMWLIQVFYSTKIGTSDATESEFDIYKDKSENKDKNSALRLAKF